jgi:hypothetical protein
MGHNKCVLNFDRTLEEITRGHKLKRRVELKRKLRGQNAEL